MNRRARLPWDLDGELDANNLYASRRLASGFWLCVQPRTYGEAQLGISFEPGDVDALPTEEDCKRALDRGWGYRSVWVYDNRDAAVAAMEAWNGDGEPAGFKRRVC